MSASQRTKGAQGEREWCDYLREHAGLNAKRVLGQARDSGGDVALPPVLYEVKRRHEIHIRKFLDQAVNALPQYKGCKMPVVALREDGRTDWMILMRASDFLILMSLTNSYGRDNLENLL